jgi:hypothetical protein
MKLSDQALEALKEALTQDGLALDRFNENDFNELGVRLLRMTALSMKRRIANEKKIKTENGFQDQRPAQSRMVLD